MPLNSLQNNFVSSSHFVVWHISVHLCARTNIYRKMFSVVQFNCELIVIDWCYSAWSCPHWPISSTYTIPIAGSDVWLVKILKAIECVHDPSILWMNSITKSLRKVMHPTCDQEGGLCNLIISGTQGWTWRIVPSRNSRISCSISIGNNCIGKSIRKVSDNLF